MYVIEGQSGVNQFKRCTIGAGATEEAAWLEKLLELATKQNLETIV